MKNEALFGDKFLFEIGSIDPEGNGSPGEDNVSEKDDVPNISSLFFLNTEGSEVFNDPFLYGISAFL